MLISNLARNFYFSFVNYVQTKHRLDYVHQSLAKKKSSLTYKSLTKDQEREVDDYWKQFNVSSYNKEWVSIYSSVCDKFDKRFLPADIYFTQIDSYFNDGTACKYLDNKNLYSLLFSGVKMPKTIVRKIAGTYLDEDYAPLSFDEAVAKCQACGDVILKPAVMGCCGIGITFWDKSKDPEKLKKDLERTKDLVVQEVIKQHPTLNLLHKSSLNTIRLMTLFLDGKVTVISGVLRMGVNGSRVDNHTSGGIACGIGPNGQLGEYAVFQNGEKIYQHPQGAKFSNITVPSYAECKELAKKLALRFVGFSKLISWDFAIDENGDPIFIEANLSFGGLHLHQMTNGPLFGDLTEKVLTKVFLNK